jgi:hypothetical protein
MRGLLVVIVGLVIAAFAVEAHSQPPVGDVGFSRAGAPYATSTSDDAYSCATACARDGICIAWTYRASANSCEFRASVSDSAADADATSGLSDRAPASMHRQTVAATPEPAQVATAEPAPPAHHTPAQPAVHEAAAVLLGGPDDADLRPELGR